MGKPTGGGIPGAEGEGGLSANKTSIPKKEEKKKKTVFIFYLYHEKQKHS